MPMQHAVRALPAEQTLPTRSPVRARHEWEDLYFEVKKE